MQWILLLSTSQKNPNDRGAGRGARLPPWPVSTSQEFPAGVYRWTAVVSTPPEFPPIT